MHKVLIANILKNVFPHYLFVEWCFIDILPKYANVGLKDVRVVCPTQNSQPIVSHCVLL